MHFQVIHATDERRQRALNTVSAYTQPLMHDYTLQAYYSFCFYSFNSITMFVKMLSGHVTLHRGLLVRLWELVHLQVNYGYLVFV